VRGLITGGATTIGGSLHALPFLISNVDHALPVAYTVVAIELVSIAWIRRRFQRVSLPAERTMEPLRAPSLLRT
jgi:hypothetical protein